MTTEAATGVLKPCPFCGSDAEMQSSFLTGENFVFCSNDRCVMGKDRMNWKKNSEQQAAERWNDRV